MKLTPIVQNGRSCALVEGEGILLDSSASALDVMIQAQYETGSKSIAIAKERIHPDFFILSTGLAGEILQKYVNYAGKIAIYGDFSRYTSKPLHDFMLESNQGRDVFFVPTLQEAIDRLTR